MRNLTLFLLISGIGLTACSPNNTSQTEQAKPIEPAASAVATTPEAIKASAPAATAKTETIKVTLVDVKTIPEGAEGNAIRDGLDIATRTSLRVPDHVGNHLNCTSCHLGNGSTPYAAPWNGVPALFPLYRARSGKVDTIEERINGCFMRSMNGKPLADDSTEMRNLIAYMTWLSKDIPPGHSPEGRGFVEIDKSLVPNRVSGKAIFEQKCVVCHGEQGEGMLQPGNSGYIYPAVAGKNSFNDGAGMARTYTAAAFIKGNMPFGQPNSLTDQEAVDVADFMSHMDRPVFALKHKDWPKGDAPKDVRR